MQDVNQKLVAFERGFISESGIAHREWYRHLVVAPGKWLVSHNRMFIMTNMVLIVIMGLTGLRSVSVHVLNYALWVDLLTLLTSISRTTMPALTEALTIEKNLTMAEHETHRLTCLIDRLVKELFV